MSDWIQTYTGKRFYPLDPRPEDICIEDIAHSLSLLCRFTGHVQEFYSVAEHCVHVSYVCKPENAICGLLHDASEAYLNDISRPVKRSPEMALYRQAEKHLQQVILDKFEIQSITDDVHEADNRMLLTEKRDLLFPVEWGVELSQIEPYKWYVHPMGWKAAEEWFLTRYRGLTA